MKKSKTKQNNNLFLSRNIHLTVFKENVDILLTQAYYYLDNQTHFLYTDQPTQ